MADGDISGFGDADVVRIDRSVQYTERQARYPLPASKYPLPQTVNEPELFIALEQFSLTEQSLANCRGGFDAPVGRCARLKYDVNTTTDGVMVGWTANQSYFRVDGEAVCIWDPTSGTGYPPGCGGELVKCGQRLWAKWNDQSERYEVVSLSRGPAFFTECPCTWFGYSIWKVVSGPAWELVGNRCSGCYDDSEGRTTLDVGLVDYRFMAVGMNADWIASPATPPRDEWINTDFRYVTCCNVVDTTVDSCSLDCCYYVTAPIPSCNSDPGEIGVILHPRGGAVDACNWSADIDPNNPDGCIVLFDTANECAGCGSEGEPGLCQFNVVLCGVYMGASSLTIVMGVFYFNFGNHFFSVVGTYSLSDNPDCESSLTATLSGVAIIPGIETTGEIEESCVTCFRGQDYFQNELFADTINVSVINCDETTTTSTSPPTTTPVPTTTTPSPTTTTASPTTTTPAPTTTSTVAPTTTTNPGSTTTTAAPTTTSTEPGSTTADPCSGTCNYIGVMDGCGGSPTGFSWSGNGNSCSGCNPTNLCQADLCVKVVSILGWPSLLGQLGSINCSGAYP